MGVAALDAFVGDAITEAIPALATRGELGGVVAKWVRDEPEAFLACFAEEDPPKALAELCGGQLTEMTFQRAGVIEGVLRDALGCPSPWERAAQMLSDGDRNWSAQEVKGKLDELVERRVKIVHKGDLKPGRGTTQSIRREDVREASRVINAVAAAVDAVINEKLAP